MPAVQAGIAAQEEEARETVPQSDRLAIEAND
jgi:hypothetical protein